jgi:hypothetical protein
MKKVILSVFAIVAMASCGKQHDEVSPSETKKENTLTVIVDGKIGRVQRDTLYGIDEQVGDVYMVIEERIVFE